MDVLSELLTAVKITGAVFYNAEFSSPWAFRSPPSKGLAPYVGAATGHIIVYHLVTDGAAWAEVDAEARTQLRAGDIVIFPHGHTHLMGNGPPVEPHDNGSALQEILSQGLGLVRSGGGGETTRLICGYLTCDEHLSRVLLAPLPRLLKVHVRDDDSGRWLEESIRLAVARTSSGEAGSAAVLAKVSEALFVDTLCRYFSALPPGESGWLAGTRDPEVGRALKLIHSRVSEPWTLALLAEAVGVSRTVLVERFTQFVGEAPMSYVAGWRMRVGARLLTTTNRSVAEIAREVAYESEAAFNRAFKRLFGMPPGRYRKQHRAEASRSAVAAKD